MPYANCFDGVVPNAPRDLREVERMLALMKKELADQFKVINFKKELMRKKVFDEQTRDLIDANSAGYVHGIVYASEDYIEFGWFKSSPENIVIIIKGDIYIGISREALPELMWSNKLGYYIYPYVFRPEERFTHRVVRGQGNFPYSFS